MEKIKVCNVIEEGRFGGPERRIVLVAKVLKEREIDTHVVYPNFDSERFSREIARASISSTPLGITRLSKEKKILIRYTLFFPVEILRLRFFLREHGFNLVHINGSYQFKTAIAAKLAGIPVIWHLNDTQMDVVVKKTCRFLAKYCASGFIVTGSRVYDYYIRGTALEKKPFVDIQPPVDTAVFDSHKAGRNKTLDRLSGRKIVTVSGINPTKGLEYFILMASKLIRKYNDISFFVAGDELTSQRKYYKYLKDLLVSSGLTNDNFTFVGLIDDVPSFLQSADIFVFTSNSESGPTAVWEAMSMAKAIVTTDVGAVNQYIEDGESGFIVPTKDVELLAKRVGLLLDDPALRQKMGNSARRIAEKELDASIAAEKHAYFYRKIYSLSQSC